jgi:formylglycine-generating enzyme required for sulfatase activity
MRARIVFLWLVAVAACSQQDGGASSSGAPDPPTAKASATAAPSTSASAAPTSAALEREDLPDADRVAKTLAEQREAMLARMLDMGVMTPVQEPAVRKIVFSTRILGQGNPAVVDHPMTRKECTARRAKAEVRDEAKPRCGSPFMTPIYDPARQAEEDAAVCIDRFEFPSMPCDYPVTWVATSQAQRLCEALDKRLCDAHEWEGACAGSLRTPKEEYAWGRPRDTMSGIHNANRKLVWSYGRKKDHARCASSSHRSKTCATSGWRGCGSNTYPAGAFPECTGTFGVYDLHGNAAEHMLLPLKPSQLGQRGGVGVAEMKGSWFIFARFEAHKDDCRWRAPSWHGDEGLAHANYHLGFRCCRDID